MEKDKKNGPLCGNTATTKEAGTVLTTEILASFDAAVKRHDLPTVLACTGLVPKEAVKALQECFPKLDKTILSKCSRPEKYGCVLHPRGYTLFRERLGAAPEIGGDEEPAQDQQNPRKRDQHRLKYRISARLPEAQYKLLQRYISLDGYATTQDWLSAQARTYIKRMGAKYGRDDITVTSPIDFIKEN